MDREVLDRAWEAVSSRWPSARPAGGMILGSGWDGVASVFAVRGELPYAEVPGLGATGVAGHEGVLSWVDSDAGELFLFRGRRHWYEGGGWTPVALPVFLLKSAGAGTVLLTNAAGGIDETLLPGDVMIVTDHVNLMGAHPLVGPHDPFWGPRFPDQTRVYDTELSGGLALAARAARLRAHPGVYLAVSGPCYETPAEIGAFTALGADAVGMSTVPEAVLARAAGLRVAALSLITNPAAGLGGGPLAHGEVEAVARRAAPRLAQLVSHFWKEAARGAAR